MSEQRYIPGGRGHREGPDAIVDQRETDLLRQEGAPSKRGWIISTHSSPFLGGAVAGAAQTADTLYMIPIGQLSYAIDVFEARIRITAGGAGSEAYTAIYYWNWPDRILQKVPRSQAKFLTTAASIPTATLAGEVTLEVGPFYWLAYLMHTTGGASSASCLTATSCITGMLTETGITGEPPGQVPHGILRRVNTTVPIVFYLNREGAAIL
jgi:hypothetical protein